MQIEQEFAMSARCRLAARGGAWRFRANFALGRRSLSTAVTIRQVGEMLAGADDGEAFVVEQPFYLKNGLDVLSAVQAMAAGTFYRLERGEFRFPVAEDESFCRG